MNQEQNYLQISHALAQGRNYEDSKLWQQACDVFGGSLINILAKRNILPEYFYQDFEAELHFQLAEEIANWVNANLFTEPLSDSLRIKLSISPDHGRDHFRRLEKWYKKAQSKDKSLRINPSYLFFSPSAFLSMKLHDLVETYTGLKENHDGAGALLALGYLLQSHEIGNDAVNIFSQGQFQEISKEDWEKIAWGTAFICLHHSKPENAPSTEELLARQSSKDGQLSNLGIIDTKELLEAAEYMLAEANKTKQEMGEPLLASIYDLFPAYELIHETIDLIREGKLQVPKFDEREIEGLKKQLGLMSAADKLDGTHPADLSAVRTFQTRPQRSFYVRMDDTLSIEQELEERIRLGGAHESPCDLDRFLFEMTRTKVFRNVSAVVQRWYGRGLLEKAGFLYTGIEGLLNSDKKTFLSAYDHLDINMAHAILIKAMYSEDIADRTVTERDVEARHARVKEYLSDIGFDIDSYNFVLQRIESERANVEEIIEYKIQGLQQMNLTREEKERIHRLLILARQRQAQGLNWIPGPNLREPLPYDGYMLVTLQ